MAAAVGRSTPYLRQKLMDHQNGVATMVVPSTLILGFASVTISPTATLLASVVECSGNGYARTTVTWSGTTWNAADASGVATNKALITCFTATANWTVAGVDFFITDGTNLWATGTMIDSETGDPKPMLPSLGQIVTFPPDSFIRTLAAAA